METFYTYEGPIGFYALRQTGEAISRLWLGDRFAGKPVESEERETPLIREAHRQLEAYFQRKLTRFDLPLFTRGTPFQEKVWAELRKIPYGTVITYGELALRIGNPHGSRAVGMANSRNPLPVLIPCHRVLGAKHKLVGYTGGLDIKVKLLEIENFFLH